MSGIKDWQTNPVAYIHYSPQQSKEIIKSLSHTGNISVLAEKLQKRKWENCMSIDKHTWGYRRNSQLNSYLSTPELLITLAETVRYEYPGVLVFRESCILVTLYCYL